MAEPEVFAFRELLFVGGVCAFLGARLPECGT